MRAKLIIGASVFVVAIVFVLMFTMGSEEEIRDSITLVKGDGEEVNVKVELAVSAEERKIGLMNRTYLPEGRGMFFIFDREHKWGFWMKNTLIPLDMIFINKDGRIVDIKHNVQPCKKILCDRYRPNEAALFVLEVNGGFSEKYNINVNDSVRLDGR